MPETAKRDWKEWLVEESKKLFVTVLYIWILLSVLQLHRAMILTSNGLPYNYWQGAIFAIVNALVLGKFIVIVEALHAGERWHHKALLYSILFKSAIFALILLVCHVLEEILIAAWHAEPLLSALQSFRLAEVLSMALIAFVTLIPFITLRELVRVVGKDQLKALFLKREAAQAGFERQQDTKG